METEKIEIIDIKDLDSKLEEAYKKYEYIWIHGYNQLSLKKIKEYSLINAMNDNRNGKKTNYNIENILQVKFFAKGEEVSFTKDEGLWKKKIVKISDEEINCGNVFLFQQVISKNIANKGVLRETPGEKLGDTKKAVLIVAKKIGYLENQTAYVKSTHFYDVQIKDLSFKVED